MLGKFLIGAGLAGMASAGAAYQLISDPARRIATSAGPQTLPSLAPELALFLISLAVALAGAWIGESNRRRIADAARAPGMWDARR